MSQPDGLRYEPLQPAHFSGVERVITRCFPDMPEEDQLTRAELEELERVFPEGTIVVLDGETVVGFGSGLFIDVDYDHLPDKEWKLIFDPEGHALHDPAGDWYYGIDIGVDPDYQGRGIGRRLYEARKGLATRYNRRGFVAAGVLPGYAAHRQALDIHDYLARVVAGELHDPTLTMQLRNGFRVVKPLQHFYEFPRSDHWCAIIEWRNPDYRAEEEAT